MSFDTGMAAVFGHGEQADAGHQFRVFKARKGEHGSNPLDSHSNGVRELKQLEIAYT
jgi:hypothetical protein